MMNKVRDYLGRLQDALNFAGCENVPQYKDKHSQGRTGFLGYALGLVGGFHAALALCLFSFAPYGVFRSSLITWALHVTFLTTFHFLEFFVTSLRQPSTLSSDSFIVNHSLNYTLAILASTLEFWLEVVFFGARRMRFPLVFFAGLVCVVGGQIIRSLAMWQCGESFNHLIAHSKPDNHSLRTEGIYSIFRHPSYFGWFYWSVGMQLVLGNFICTLAYAYVSWSFFAERIPYEEACLLRFYGRDYVRYSQSTMIGIPFISGAVLNDQQSAAVGSDDNNTNRSSPTKNKGS